MLNLRAADVTTRPKSEALFDRMRAHILEGRFLPGQWLKQADLESLYDAGRSEVRAALSSLSDRGLVEYEKNLGFRVSNRGPEDIRDVTEMIVVLEAASVPAMVANVTDADLAELDGLARQFEELTRRGNHAELRLANYTFHARLNALGRNKMMAQVIQNLRECCVVGPFSRYASFDGLQASSAEHFAILAALRARDAAGLADLMRAHASHMD